MAGLALTSRSSSQRPCSLRSNHRCPNIQHSTLTSSPCSAAHALCAARYCTGGSRQGLPSACRKVLLNKDCCPSFLLVSIRVSIKLAVATHVGGRPLWAPSGGPVRRPSQGPFRLAGPFAAGAAGACSAWWRGHAWVRPASGGSFEAVRSCFATAPKLERPNYPNTCATDGSLLNADRNKQHKSSRRPPSSPGEAQPATRSHAVVFSP